LQAPLAVPAVRKHVRGPQPRCAPRRPAAPEMGRRRRRRRRRAEAGGRADREVPGRTVPAGHDDRRRAPSRRRAHPRPQLRVRTLGDRDRRGDAAEADPARSLEGGAEDRRRPERPGACLRRGPQPARRAWRLRPRLVHRRPAQCCCRARAGRSGDGAPRGGPRGCPRPVRHGAGGQLAAGLVALGASAAPAAAGGPYRWEVAVFEAANGMPDALHPAVWTVMQLGALGAGPALGAAAWRAGRPDLAARMVVGATASWALAKAVKRVVDRGRPAALVPGTRVRGKEATAGGYPSGHAAVAAALMTAAASAVPAHRRLFGAAAAGVGLARMYVGAHLPLD